MSTTVEKAAPARRAIRWWLAALLLFGAAPARAAADPVLEWNDIAREFIVVPALSPVEQTRAMAIVHVAMHDAINAITGRFERYAATASPPAGSSPEAAAIGAAAEALRFIVGNSPDLQSALTARYQASLQAHGLSSTDRGVVFGQAVAATIVELRRYDGAALAKYVYVPPDAGSIGVWQPISSAASAQSLLPGWGEVTRWVLRNDAQFFPDTPVAIDSEQYARDFNEIQAIGAVDSVVRTNEQTQIALFWRASPTAIWNPVLRQAIALRQPTLSDRARVSALFYLAAADASVACWSAKYFYNYWRPQPAIVRGDDDGNPATAGDPGWRPLVGTPPHPEYPSGHASNSGAMAAILALLFDDDPGFIIEATSSQSPGFVRHWRTFREGVEEVIDARVYSGIHFRTSDEAGARLGRQIARFVFTHALKPVKQH
jgi:hypothetical protein